MNRYDVYLVDLDPTRGSEIAKTRPAVIVSPDVMNQSLRTVIVAPLTSTLKGWPSRIATTFGRQNGEIALDQLRAVDKSRLTQRLGKLDKPAASATSARLVEMFEA